MDYQYFVYLKTNKNNTVIYTGVTNDLKRRVYEHKEKLIDGFTKKYNVNKSTTRCGATCPSTLRAAVRQHRADLGIALDGDGDRLVMVAGQGEVYDGDQLLYVIACHRPATGTLKGGVVGTLMTNLALENALKSPGIPFQRAAVGDRYVLEQLIANGWQLGGEGSGHIVCLRDRHTTSDGIVSALQVLHALRRTQRTLAEATAGRSCIRKFSSTCAWSASSTFGRTPP